MRPIKWKANQSLAGVEKFVKRRNAAIFFPSLHEEHRLPITVSVFVDRKVAKRLRSPKNEPDRLRV